MIASLEATSLIYNNVSYNVSYYPIGVSETEEIKFAFEDENGDQLEFRPGKFGVLLHFKAR